MSFPLFPSFLRTSRWHKESTVAEMARGTFEVKIDPLTPYNMSEGALLGRMSIDKLFHGDLEAASQGEMLSAGTAVAGSAAYVAIERVTGTLAGKRGSFVLQHTGIMDRGAPSLVVTIVPDSGTDELEGLAGTMQIIIEGGAHSYLLEYEVRELQEVSSSEHG